MKGSTEQFSSAMYCCQIVLTGNTKWTIGHEKNLIAIEARLIICQKTSDVVEITQAMKQVSSVRVKTLSMGRKSRNVKAAGETDILQLLRVGGHDKVVQKNGFQRSRYIAQYT